MKPEVLNSWSLEIDYSRAPCLGGDQKARGLWERDCLADASQIAGKASRDGQDKYMQIIPSNKNKKP